MGCAWCLPYSSVREVGTRTFDALTLFFLPSLFAFFSVSIKTTTICFLCHFPEVQNDFAVSSRYLNPAFRCFTGGGLLLLSMLLRGLGMIEYTVFCCLSYLSFLPFLGYFLRSPFSIKVLACFLLLKTKKSNLRISKSFLISVLTIFALGAGVDLLVLVLPVATLLCAWWVPAS